MTVLDLFSSNGYDAESRSIVVRRHLDLTAFFIKSELTLAEDSELIDTIKVLLQFKFFSSDAGGFVDYSSKTGEDLDAFMHGRTADLYAIEMLLSEGHDKKVVEELVRHQFGWCGTGMKEVDENSPLGQLIKAFTELRKKAQSVDCGQ